MVAVAVIGSAVVGAGATIGASQTAASAEKSAASQAASVQENAAAQSNSLISGMFNTVQGELSPYISAGLGAVPGLDAAIQTGTTASNYINDNLSSLIAPINLTEAQLQQTPGYQFDLSQGEQAVTNSNVARGLGLSGAQLKGAESYATGLADNTYQTQFNIAQANATNTWNRLIGAAGLGTGAASTLAGLGTSAASSLAGNATTTGSTEANNLLNAGQAAAGGITGAANASAAASTAAGTGVTNASNSVSQYYLTNALLNGMNGGSIYNPSTSGPSIQSSLATPFYSGN